MYSACREHTLYTRHLWLHMSQVFISYSHDSDAHRDRVQSLADQLRERGFDITTDADVKDPPVGWARWMEEQLPKADRVLMVFTETYRSRYDGNQPSGAGRGVAWETHLIRNMLYASVPFNNGIRAVIFLDDDKQHIPLLLRAHNYYLLPSKLDDLCEWLNDEAIAVSTLGVEKPGPLNSQAVHESVVPFQEVGALKPSDASYIRRKADSELAALLDDPNIVCLAITGDYGIGKTSLLNRVPPMLGEEWVTIRPSIADLRTDSAELCVPHLLEEFAPLAGSVTKPSELHEAFRRRPALLLLDDFGEIQKAGLNAILPMLMDLAIESKGRFRIVGTLPLAIRALLKTRGITNPRHHKPWKEVVVLPLEDKEMKQLLQLLPEKVVVDAVLERMDLVKQHCQSHPKRFRIMLNQMCEANPEDFERIIDAAGTNDR